MTSISVGYITTDNDIPFLLMSIEQIETYVDEIIIIQNSMGDNTNKLINYIKGRDKYKHIITKYSGNNGSEYNKILRYVSSEWLLILDSDEVISDNAYLLRDYAKENKFNCYSIRMNHCVYDLAHIDSSLAGDYNTTDNKYDHYVIKRFFKMKKGIHWDDTEHSTIQGFDINELGLISDVIIWHYGKAKNVLELRDKYRMNLSRSTIHNKAYLDGWYFNHLIGSYPRKIINIKEHPGVVRREFYINELRGKNKL